MKFSKYYLAAISAYTLWGIFGLVLKPLAVHPALDLLFYRVFFSAALLSIFNLAFRRNTLRQNFRHFRQQPARIRKNTLLLSLAGGLLLIVNWLSFIYVMNHVNINAASFAYLICPILTTLLAYFLLGEKLGRWQWTAIAISCLACLLLSFDNFRNVFYSLVVALSYALYLVSQRQNTIFDRFTLITIQVLIASAALIPVFPSLASPFPSGEGFYLVMLGVALIFTIIPLYLNLYALTGLSSATMGILIYLNPLVNFLLAVLYFGEEISLAQFLGYSMTVASIVIFNRSSDEAFSEPGSRPV